MDKTPNTWTKDDEFGDRCRMRTTVGKRCRKTAKWLVPMCVSRESWLAALRTGWPRLVRGMKQPEYRQVGLCRLHGYSQFSEETRYFYGIGKVGPAKLGPDPGYEAAKQAGDEAVRAGGFSA